EKTILDNFKKLTEFNDLELDLEKAKKLLKDVSLKKELEVDASKLSGGEAQRLALARAMYLDSDVILLDEPSSALDDETEKIVIEMICNYVKENSKSLIMVTHSKKVAKTYADIIYTIDKGKIKEFNQI
ncbi:MAG: ATP-binding cassette domain-containing protein, partial [Bacilli bacterium]|nr:ATP-binding cassette domain-containing protein [Bacilli bacterium]